MGTFSAADGTRIAYETRGTGPLLVCVPGGPGRAPDYRENLGGLAATRTLLLLHPRGVDDPATFVAAVEPVLSP